MTTTFHAPAWRILRELRHAGVTYSIPEAVPEMTMEEALGYESQGLIARLDADTRPVLLESERTAELFMSAPDHIVLFRIRDEKPPKIKIRAMLKIAETNGRRVLAQALKMKLRDPITDIERNP